MAAIADDFTGGSDLAGMLFEQGVRTVLLFGNGAIPGGYAAAVVCLKTRSIGAGEARALTRQALQRLSAQKPRQIQFKYCSTFDSTPAGNIGPVIDELMAALGTEYTVAVPALPVNGRTQYLGHLFVNGVPLNESPMRHHPLNPMTDSNLVRWLQRQTVRRVGLLALPEVRNGQFAAAPGVEVVVVDAIADEDLARIAEAVCDLPLITGGSGLGMKLPAVWRRRGLLPPVQTPVKPPPARPGALILAGSCSAATLDQLSVWECGGYPAIAMNVGGLGEPELERLERAARTELARRGVALIRSSALPACRVPGAAADVEQAFARLAARLTPAVGRLIVAGGETAGAVVDALGIHAVELTGILDPGVPALRTIGEPDLRLALKSGNFGSRDFFLKALRDE